MKVKEIVMKEAVLKAIEPGKRATIDDPASGKTIELDLTKPENAASLRPNDQGQLEYDPTPDLTTPGAQGQGGPTVGSEVTIKTDEELAAEVLAAEEVGGDPTDDFIDDVVDHEYGQQNESDLYRIVKLSGLK
jgi:hypothetical protein